MRILITGGTGFVGRHLSQRLLAENHEVTVLTRGSSSPGGPGRARSLQGDPTRAGTWQEAVKDHPVLINLAGSSIFGRWSEEYKKQLRESRILTTRNLVEAIRPGSDTVLFSASGVGYYGFHDDEELDESSPPGDDFLAGLSSDWEAEALAAEKKGVRVVITRFGIVLGKTGGALQQMIAPFRWFAGGPIGDGRQWFSWIHVQDLVEAFVHLLARGELKGPFNFTAPHPLRNKDFSSLLGQAMGRPSWLPAPAFMIRIVLGEFGSVILKGQRVLPTRLMAGGFRFAHPEAEGALRDLLG